MPRGFPWSSQLPALASNRQYLGAGWLLGGWAALWLASCVPEGGEAKPDGDSAVSAEPDSGEPEDTVPPPVDVDGDGASPPEDCDDNDPNRFPDAHETCNGIDDDCNGVVDDDANDAEIFYADTDRDGFGDPTSGTLFCVPFDGYVRDASDCDDTDDTAFPGANEVCDGDDDDCDGDIDEDSAVDAPTWFSDTDADGFGDPSTGVVQCDAPAAHVADNTDCDDTNAAHHPDADEVCDGDDDDCDGDVDEDSAIDAATWYADTDADGYGDVSAASQACQQPSGSVADNTDCDDSEALHNPAADETCDGDDDDCDGDIDEDSAVDAETWYLDADADGYGDASTGVVACEAPSGTVLDATDCDDADADENPAADEVCDGDDDDCDGDVDEDSAVDATTWYPDADGDGYGDLSAGAPACLQPTDTVTDGTDCDDSDPDEHPGADEICDGDDDDCDGDVDEDSAVDAPSWYPDADGDGFGDASSSIQACTEPSGTAATATDCDDTDPAVNPDAEELCWTTDDEDCDTDAGLDDTDCAPDGAVAATEVDVAIAGPASSARLGEALAANADVNGDGIDDLLVTSDDYGSGASWLFLGTTSIERAVWVPSLADQAISGGTGANSFGRHAALGDISGDGLADIILGDPLYDVVANEGAVFVFFGAATLSSTRSSSGADLTVSTSEEGAQLSPVAAGDLDGDGVAELVVGAPNADGAHGTMNQAGRLGVFLGPVTGSQDLDDADRQLWGDHPDDYAGQVLAIVPDMDGDGLADLAVAATERDWDAEDDGAVYVLYDATAGADAKMFSADLVIRGAGGDFGDALAGGDLDADGYGDLVVGVPGDDTADTDAGAVLVFAGPYGSGTRLDAADATHMILGEVRNDDAGEAVAVGDVDGDGYADLMVGAGDHDEGGTNAGAVYGLRGPLSGSSIDLSLADWEQAGGTGEGLGATVATGDLNGDGYADVVASSPAASGSYSSQGEVSVLLGGGRVSTPTAPTVVDPTDDADGDGFSEDAGDCDDTRASIYPGAAETCNDGIDDDCDGIDPGCTPAALEDADSAWMQVHGERSNATGTVVLGGFDLNADGNDDLAVGGPNDDKVSIWFGPLPQGPTRTLSPDLVMEGGDGTGSVLARGGDLNGDGIDDLVVGAPESDDTYSNGGAVYVLLGSSDLGGELSFPTDADLVFTPEAADDALGIAVAGGTDLDGDGIDDLVFGADAGGGRVGGEGAVYVVYGGRTVGTWAADTADHIFGGESLSDSAGASVSFAGDVNGDGEQDLLIGAPDLLESRGGAYLVFGPFDAGFTDLATVRARFIGADYTGTTVAGVGDLNADGYDDIAVGAPGFSGSGSVEGALHVFFGPLAPAHYLVADAPLVIEGDAGGDMMGLSVASASGGSTDIDGDGYADLLVGTPYSDTYWTNSGGAWLYYGPFSAGTLGTADADVAYDGYYGGYSGLSLDVAGDVDGDGYQDVVVGSPNARVSAWSWVSFSYAGSAFIWRGGDRGSTAVTPTVLDVTDDADGDGYSEDGGDCDDTNAAVYPGATEVCENDLDDDCDGFDLWCVASGSVTIASDPSLQSATNYDHGTATVLTDIDGDGYDDLVVGERASRAGATNGGQLYWMFGPLQRGELEISGSRDPDRWVYASTRDDYLGGDAWVAGDIDGDGLDDLIVGAVGAGTGGEAYLLAGSVSATGGSDVTAVATTTFTGLVAGDNFGARVSSGDLNGDGVSDFVVTAPGESTGASLAGTAYVFLGPVSAGTVSASTADATVSADTYLASLEAAEVVADTDGDGLDDLLLGAHYHEGTTATWGTGEAWLFTTGPASGALSIADADVTFEAEAAGDQVGADVASGGDIDGDGLTELLIGASSSSEGTYSRGGIGYLFYGGTVSSGTVDLGTAATRFLGSTSNAYVGDGLGTAGDVDGDGLDDLLIGEPRTDTLYLFRAPVPTGDVTVTSSDADFWPWGETYYGQVGHPGDQDGDGYDDIVVAAPDSFGRVWVSLGGID